jgi:hypothetical protein
MSEPDSPDSPTHQLEHISRIIRQRYPESHPARETETPALVSTPVNDVFIAAATTIVLIATPTSIYLLANERLPCSLAAFVTALAAAFAPKIYADFIQPRAPSAVIQTPEHG